MRVAVITTSRADWNALQPVVRALRAEGSHRTVVLAIHDHGMGVETLRAEVGEDVYLYGHPRIGPEGLTSRDAWALMDLGQRLPNYGQDIVVLCGDRHETLVAAHAAVLAGIPIAHIAGGDVTTGSSDDKYRDAISMLADMHFPTHEAAADRLLVMGCGPNVYCYGSPAVDRLMRTAFMPRAETCKALGLEDARPFILANWQPETPRDGSGLDEMLKALAFQSLPGVFVGVNPDPGADSAELRIGEFVLANPQWRRHANLRPDLYLSALLHAHCLIGNSSSGFYEAPYLGTPVINIGARQSGRAMSECMTWVHDAKVSVIKAALDSLEKGVRYDAQQLYGDGAAAPKIAKAILTPLVHP